jgi:hypothetical protein
MENGNTKRRGKPIPWLVNQTPWNKKNCGILMEEKPFAKVAMIKLKDILLTHPFDVG